MSAVLLSAAGIGRADIATTQGREGGGTALRTRVQAEVLRPVTKGAAKPELKLVPAGTVEQGEVLFYTLRITNSGAESVADGTVIQAVPANTRVIAGSMNGAGAQIDCSVDGGSTFLASSDLPLARQSPAGHTLLPCTHLRWRLKSPLPPGAVLLARFRAEFR